MKTGDWIVEQGTWGTVSARPILKVTAKLLFCRSEYSNNQRRIRPDDVLFCGTEQEAKKVMERLVSSSALATQEANNAQIRRRERDKKIIATAVHQQTAGDK